MEDNFRGCYFIGEVGLFKVYCNFLVICIIDVNKIVQGDIVTVSDVKSSESGILIYKIDGNYYYHHYFTLYLKPTKNEPNC